MFILQGFIFKLSEQNEDKIGNKDGRNIYHLGGSVNTDLRVVGSSSFGDSYMNIDSFIQKVRYTNGCLGSVMFTNDTRVMLSGWYNYIYMPHRFGGVDGESINDNCYFGTLLLFPMVQDNNSFVVRTYDGGVASIKTLV